MDHPPGLEGLPFPVPDPSIVESCIDYWFDESEMADTDNPLVPEGFRAIARDPGDDLVALSPEQEVFYISHEDGRLIRLAENLKAFYSTFASEP